MIYINYIDSSELPFRPIKVRMKNGKYVYFRDGKALEVEYKVRYLFSNIPEGSGIDYSRYDLVKNKDGDYKIISCGY